MASVNTHITADTEDNEHVDQVSHKAHVELKIPQLQGWVYEQRVLPVPFNPITAPACKISGLKVHGHPCKQSIFWLDIAPTFNAMRFDENAFTYHCEKEYRKAKGFRISHF